MSWQSTAIVAAPAAQPLRHWSNVQLERALRAVERVWREWGERWQLTADVVAAVDACDDATTSESEAWPWTRGGSLALSAGRSDATDALGTLLFGRDDAHSNSPIANELATEALADLLRSLGQLGTGASADIASAAGNEAPHEAEGSRWSGALRIQLALARDDQPMTWLLHCSPALASALCGGGQPHAAATRPALADVADAIATQSLRFKVCLDETTLTLGTLQSLQVGDVLPLSHRLDSPLHVIAPDASSETSFFCAAYLGSRDRHRAVELVPVVPASHQIDS